MGGILACAYCDKSSQGERSKEGESASNYSFTEWQALKKMTDAKQKKDETKRVFKLIDTDGSGTISKQELRDFFMTMDGLNENDKKNMMADKIFKQIDEDGGQSISEYELRAY